MVASRDERGTLPNLKYRNDLRKFLRYIRPKGEDEFPSCRTPGQLYRKYRQKLEGTGNQTRRNLHHGFSLRGDICAVLEKHDRCYCSHNNMVPLIFNPFPPMQPRTLSLAVLTPLVLPAASDLVDAQIMGPDCNLTMDWSFNSLGQSPCIVAVYMIATCNDSVFIPPTAAAR
ncbi:hypothetical protein EDB92DRAFT_332841 [Lactarius akahatsu]|uniref:Uncharacterized protein n=1 Tax=Lactarius akahatsu TaxID=416441 RepID=A0AAD4Q8E3_9AGAM|nr:hypothetical protein EDB92DRAFT_332841 [Lactarius akahatsu]